MDTKKNYLFYQISAIEIHPNKKGPAFARPFLISII